MLFATSQAIGGNVSQTSTANHSNRHARRSTRLDHSVPVTVVGVDSSRGPYREDVSTSIISCHGCKYESKYEVLDNSVVVLELTPDDGESTPVTTRGRVKWARRPAQVGGLFQTAIEFDQPSNLWHLEVAPNDWQPFDGAPTDSDLELSSVSSQAQAAAAAPTHSPTHSPTKTKPFAVPRPEIVEPAHSTNESKRATAEVHKPNGSHVASNLPTPPVPANARPVGHVMNDFQEQMEKMLAEAAVAAVRERAGSTLAEARTMLHDEAKHAVAVAATSESRVWIEQTVQQMKTAGNETAHVMQEEWNRKLQGSVDRVIERVDEHRKEMALTVDGLTTKAIDQLAVAIENTRREGMDRIISRLKEQLSPILASTNQAASNLNQLREETQQVTEQFLERSSSRMEETYERMRGQFEKLLEKRIETAREDLDKLTRAAANSCVDSLRELAVRQESEARERLQQSFTPIANTAISELRERAEETTHQFSEELSERSRDHLEFVGSAISEAARGFSKSARDEKK
jgi:hypothetical protein